MFKIGDIVVRTNNTYKPETNFIETNNGFIFKCLRNSHRAYYKQSSSCQENNVRKATDEEIKWFEAGITNINQIPEIGGTFSVETIKNINYSLKYPIISNAGSYSLKYWLGEYSKRYKPPIKSTVDRDVMFSKPFEINDLKNCKIGNLTPEDHKIIQPWLFSLGYKWQSGAHLTKIDQPYLCTTGDNYIFKKSNITDFSRLQRTLIRKETILNYIKLNINNNYEQINKKREIKPESRAIRGSSIRIPVITGRIASASRLIGNKASGKCVKSQIRKFEIVPNIITC